MKKYLLFWAIIIICSNLSYGATYRTYIGHFLNGQTYSIWINTDTALGETALAEISFTPMGGGTAYSGVVSGSFNTTTVMGANWRVDITLPNGATNITLQLATKNQSAMNYGFSGFFTMGNLLPVSLSDFGLKSMVDRIIVSWQTSSETNNDYFEVLHSATGKDFQVMGMVRGAGNSNTIQSYEFLHQNPGRGRSFYRLRQVDFDGKYEYSPVRSVQLDQRKDITLAPNPASSDIALIHDGSYTTIDITIRDITGRVVQQHRNFTAASLDISVFHPGLYTITFVADNEVISRKLIKE